MVAPRPSGIKSAADGRVSGGAKVRCGSQARSRAPSRGVFGGLSGACSTRASVVTTADPAPAAASDGTGFVETARGLWRDERVEIVATILLSISVVLSAWAAYQATKWSGEQADKYASSAAVRAQASTHNTVASRQVQIDVATFLAWSQAAAQKDETLADFVRTRFRAEFVPAFEAWRNGGSRDAQGLPAGTPFDQPQYVLAEQTAANDLVAQADAAMAEAQRANGIGDNFILTAVLFASVLFFAGTAAKFRPPWIRWSMIVVAVVVFTIGVGVVLSLPQDLSL
jgi:hypothetical protein